MFSIPHAFFTMDSSRPRLWVISGVQYTLPSLPRAHTLGVMTYSWRGGAFNSTPPCTHERDTHTVPQRLELEDHQVPKRESDQPLHEKVSIQDEDLDKPKMPLQHEVGDVDRFRVNSDPTKSHTQPIYTIQVSKTPTGVSLAKTPSYQRPYENMSGYASKMRLSEYYNGASTFHWPRASENGSCKDPLELKDTDPLPLEWKDFWLGRGTTGGVHAAAAGKEFGLQDYVAVKTIRTRHGRNYHDAVNEINTLRKVCHNHIVAFLGSYTKGDTIGLVMFPLAQCDLADYMLPISEYNKGNWHHPNTNQNVTNHERVGPLRTAFGCLCQAVIYLHGAQIKHKDIKPSNILVHNDTVILTDFGIAHDYSDLDEGSNTGGPTGFTAAYAAPEVVRQERRNRSADIFSLGCVFLEMITVVLGETLEGLHKEVYPTYSSSLDKMGKWVVHLKGLECRHKKPPIVSRGGCEFLPDHNLDDAALDCILRMMSSIAQKRPTPEDSWEVLKVIGKTCLDCQFKAYHKIALTNTCGGQELNDRQEATSALRNSPSCSGVNIKPSTLAQDTTNSKAGSWAKHSDTFKRPKYHLTADATEKKPLTNNLKFSGPFLASTLSHMPDEGLKGRAAFRPVYLKLFSSAPVVKNYRRLTRNNQAASDFPTVARCLSKFSNALAGAENLSRSFQRRLNSRKTAKRSEFSNLSTTLTSDLSQTQIPRVSQTCGREILQAERGEPIERSQTHLPGHLIGSREKGCSCNLSTLKPSGSGEISSTEFGNQAPGQSCQNALETPSDSHPTTLSNAELVLPHDKINGIEATADTGSGHRNIACSQSPDTAIAESYSQLKCELREMLIDFMVEEYRNILGCVPGLINYAPTGSHSSRIPEQSHSTGGSSSTGRGQPDRNSQRIWSSDDDYENTNDDEDTQCDVRSFGPHLPRARFACPFYKRNTQNPRNARACAGPGWPDTSKVKEHLYRNHVRHECPRCFQVFARHAALRGHLRAAEACLCRDRYVGNEYDWDQGFNEDQMKKLKSRKGRRLLTEEEKWKDIYGILFPKDPESEIPSPYYDTVSPSMIRDVQHRFQTRFPNESFISRLEALFTRGPTNMQERQRLIEHVVSTSVRQAFEGVFGDHITLGEPLPHGSNSTLPSSSENQIEVNHSGPTVRTRQQTSPTSFPTIQEAFAPMAGFAPEEGFPGFGPDTDEGYTTKPGTERSPQLCLPTSSTASPFAESGYDPTLPAFLNFESGACWQSGNQNPSDD